MKTLLLSATLALTLSACATAPPPAPKVRLPPPQHVIEKEQAIALEIIAEIRKIESTPESELSIADKSRRKSLYFDLKEMRGNHLFKGRSAEHLSWQVLGELE